MYAMKHHHIHPYIFPPALPHSLRSRSNFLIFFIAQYIRLVLQIYAMGIETTT